MQNIFKLSGMHRPKGDDDDEEEDHQQITRANTRANAASNIAIAGAELEEESDVGSTDTGTNTETDATDTDGDSESVSTGNNEDDDDDDDFADIGEIGFEEAAVETPAMLAKKMATAASTVANSDAKKRQPLPTSGQLRHPSRPRGKPPCRTSPLCKIRTTTLNMWRGATTATVP